MSFKSRGISKIVLSVEQSEGRGARVRRSIGRPELKNFDPFLLLDEFKSSSEAVSGFPDHPHRGFETVTYVLPTSQGSFQHEDFCGHKGTIEPGALQWMTAGRGIVHSEMPFGSGVGHGLQLWVNLHSKDKMCEPAYQELKADEITTVKKDGITAIVIAGNAFGVESKVYTRTPIHYTHFMMEPNTVLQHHIPVNWTSFIYVLSGKIKVENCSTGQFIEAHNTVALNEYGDGVIVYAGEEGSSFVLISGQPIGEKVVQHGPFVMNSQTEITQAFDDYRNGKNGFEKAPGWESEIGKVLLKPSRR
ncbi:pirin-like [Bradysia coprophila]|uniref:pirin-like n=1 Tax=Bradysia coprophila TaxID=38358 RepID=UPI00187D7C98|nr:pirin-like [Bradysia coprophila]